MLTEEYLKEQIIKEDYIKVGNKTTICILILKSGFEVIGTSACVDHKMFDIEIGKIYAKEKAIEKLWELYGFLNQNNQ